MKSCSADVVMRGRKLSRLGTLSFVALMGLFLAVGKAVAAVELKLHQRNSSGEFVELKKINEDETKKASKWLVDEFSQDNFVKTVKTFNAEPFKMAEAFKASILQSIKAGNWEGDAGFKKKWEEALKNVKGSENFGVTFRGFSKEKGFREMLTLIMGLSKEQLESEEFLRDLFSSATLRADLGIEEKPDTAEGDKGKDELKKQLDALREQMEELKRKAVAPPAPVPAPAPAPVPSPVAPRLPGEVSDDAAFQQALKACEDFRRRQEEQARNLIDPLKAGLEKLLADAAKQNQIPERRKKDDKNIDDVLPALLDALKPEKTPPQIPPSAPPVASAPPKSNNQGDKGIFDQPIPKKAPEEPEEEPQNQPPYFPPSNANAGPIEVKFDIPASDTGRIEYREGQDVLANMNQWKPVAATLPPNAGLPELVTAKAKVSAKLAEVSAAASNARQAANQLADELEPLRQGVEKRLNSQTKQRRDALQAEIEQKKKQLEQQKQMAGQLAQRDPRAQQAQQAMIQQIYGLQQEVNDKEGELNRLNQAVKAEAENAEERVRALVKRQQRLESLAGKLDGEVNKLKEEETAMSQLVNTNVQMQMAALQAPPSAGTPNKNRISGFSGARTASPGRVGLAPAMGSAGATSGGVERGPLRGVGQ